MGAWKWQGFRMSFGSSLLPSSGDEANRQTESHWWGPSKARRVQILDQKFSGPCFIPVLFSLAPQGCHSYSWSPRCHGLLSKHSRCWPATRDGGGKTSLQQNLHSAKDACNGNTFSGERSLWLTLSISFVRKKAKRASLAACMSSRKPSVCLWCWKFLLQRIRSFIFLSKTRLRLQTFDRVNSW